MTARSPNNCFRLTSAEPFSLRLSQRESVTKPGSCTSAGRFDYLTFALFLFLQPWSLYPISRPPTPTQITPYVQAALRAVVTYSLKLAMLNWIDECYPNTWKVSSILCGRCIFYGRQAHISWKPDPLGFTAASILATIPRKYTPVGVGTRPPDLRISICTPFIHDGMMSVGHSLQANCRTCRAHCM